MEFGILGPLEVRGDSGVIELRRGRPRTLVTALILRLGETVSSDSLVDLLWGDDLPQDPANALQVQVSYLRRTLEQGGEGPPPISTRAGGYALEVDREAIDALRFEQSLRQARDAAKREDLVKALRVLDEALGLWRGDALADTGDAFRGEATRLNELRWDAVEKRNDVLLALGRHREIIGELAQLVGEQPLRERFHEQLVLALYRADRQADALRAYDKARTMLLEELGLEPGGHLQELQRQVLAQDPKLDLASQDEGPHPMDQPPPVVRARSAAVPVPVTPTVGRRAEVSRLTDLLAKQRLVTLTGPGGAGKTRLAIEVARHEEHDAEVVYVDLGPVASSELVASTVANSVGVSAPPGEDIADLVAASVADRPTLVVLDTCEHVLDGASVLASRIVRTSPTSRVLATSRRPLGIAGEIAWPVPPLALAATASQTADAVREVAAIELFAERASAVRPGFHLTDDNAGDVAAICLALDGLPLAIELAAARADVLTPAAIRARLEDRFSLLVDGSTDGAPRQQTLRATLDWSYELLDEGQRELFGRLSVFPAPFDLDALTAVAGDQPDDPLTRLAALVRHSVVMVVGDDRYRLLDSVRAYASEKLEDAGPVRLAHAEHYAHVAESSAPHLRGHEQIEWLARMRNDLPQFRAALSWASSSGEEEIAARLAATLAWFWTVEGMLDEAVTMMERALTIVDAPPAIRSRIRSGYGLLVASLGRVTEARAAGEDAVDLARTAGDDSVLGDALNTAAVAQWALGDLAIAAGSHEEAIECYERANDVWGIAVARTLRTRTGIDAGEAGVDERARVALAAARRSGDRHIVAIAVDQLARIHLGRGEVSDALRLASECVGLQQQLGYTEGIVASLHLLGRLQLAGGELDDAERTDRRALSLASSIGHAAATCEAIDELARIALVRGLPEQAHRYVASVNTERERRGLARRAAEAVEIDEVVRKAGAEMPAGTDDEAIGLDELVREILAVSDP